jgi:hypothetical protein
MRISLLRGDFHYWDFQKFPKKILLCVFWAKTFHCCNFRGFFGLKIAVMKKMDMPNIEKIALMKNFGRKTH